MRAFFNWFINLFFKSTRPENQPLIISHVTRKRRLYKKVFAKKGTFILVVKAKVQGGNVENYAVLNGGLSDNEVQEIEKMLLMEIEIGLRQ